MATGRAAFAGETPAEIATAIAGRQPPHPRKVNPRLPSGAGRIIVGALAKDPERRYQSAAELFEDLRRARTNAALLGRLPPRFQSRRSLVAAGVVVGGIAIATASVAMTGRGRGWWQLGSAPAERSMVLVSQIANGTSDPDFEGTLREAVTCIWHSRPIWISSPTSASGARCS